MADWIPLLTPDEEQIMSAIGYLVVRWNYADHSTRLALRPYLEGESLLDEDHIKLSNNRPKTVAARLAQDLLPRWGEPGRTYLERLIDAYNAAREHRNHIVHGVNSTFPPLGDRPACALVIPGQPYEKKLEAPSYVSLDELKSMAGHFHDLAMFAREVAIAFAKDGSIALNHDGSPVLEDLPALIPVLPPVERTLISKEDIGG